MYVFKNVCCNDSLEVTFPHYIRTCKSELRVSLHATLIYSHGALGITDVVEAHCYAVNIG